MTMYTFGYEGMSIRTFVDRLQKAEVQIVVDVRQLPLSRKKGFSKNALSETLARCGIEYTHIPAFGCPKPIRDQYKADGDWSAYVRKFERHLAAQDEAVKQLAVLVARGRACLICFEADHNRCHRSLVARAAALTAGQMVTHLTLKGEVPEPLRKRAA